MRGKNRRYWHVCINGEPVAIFGSRHSAERWARELEEARLRTNNPDYCGLRGEITIRKDKRSELHEK